MSTIKNLESLPETRNLGNQSVFVLPLEIKVARDSFLHIGATDSPLADKKQPVFSVDGQPVIPASSFKGVFRQQVEMIFIKKKDQLADTLGLIDDQLKYLLKPSIPASRPSKAEKDLFNQGYRKEHSSIKVDEDKIEVPRKNNQRNGDPIGLCPVSYFFGATGIEGYLRISPFFPVPGEWRIDQTRIRIDRKSQTAAPGALVTGEQVKPGSTFNGEILIFKERQGSSFGKCRRLGGVDIDLWLKNWVEADDPKRKMFLINEIVIPALSNITVLGGQKSLGGGVVNIHMER